MLNYAESGVSERNENEGELSFEIMQHFGDDELTIVEKISTDTVVIFA